MKNTEAAKILREWTTRKHGLFAWPLDSDYEQHMKFVAHRNENWEGGSKEDWKQFILDYADSLLSNLHDQTKTNMKRSDLDSNIQVRQHFQDVYEKLRIGRRQLLKVDIKPGEANRVLYKSTLQWLNSAIDELVFEDELAEIENESREKDIMRGKEVYAEIEESYRKEMGEDD